MVGIIDGKITNPEPNCLKTNQVREHILDDEGICWCSPKVIELDGTKRFVHKEEQ